MVLEGLVWVHVWEMRSCELTPVWVRCMLIPRTQRQAVLVKVPSAHKNAGALPSKAAHTLKEVHPVRRQVRYLSQRTNPRAFASLIAEEVSPGYG